MLAKTSHLFYLGWIIILMLLGTSYSFAESMPVKKDFKTLNIGVSFAIPPWVITETNSGIELDILNQAFDMSGYQVKPNYLSFAMSYALFESGKLDGVINAKESSLNSGFFSEPVVTFRNVAISLKEKNFPDDIDISFLNNKSVVAFQNASSLLGDEFHKMSQKNLMYQEMANQNLQINLLMIRNIDFIILDKSIFGYYWQKAQNNPNFISVRSKLDRPVRFHYLFEPNRYRFVFSSEKVRNDFNFGLNQLKQNGEYDQILERYAHLNDLYANDTVK